MKKNDTNWSAVLTAILVALILWLLLASCALSPQEQVAAGHVLDDMLREGRLTSEQHRALSAALARGEWSTIWNSVIEVVVAVGLSLVGVRQWRGGITQRKGVVPVVVDTDGRVAIPQPSAVAPAPSMSPVVMVKPGH